MIKVNVISEEKSWSKKIKKKEFLFDKIIKYFPDKFKFLNQKAYLTLLLSNNKKIKVLNQKFRKKNKHTDVLSFPCLLYTSPSPRDVEESRMPSSA